MAPPIVFDFTVPITPVPRQLRTVVRKGLAINYLGDRDKDARADIAACFRQTFGRVEPITGPVRLILTFRLRKGNGVGQAVSSRPDIDNLSVPVMNALSGLAYQDDRQVAELVTRKVYGIPGIHVRVEPMVGAAVMPEAVAIANAVHEPPVQPPEVERHEQVHVDEVDQTHDDHAGDQEADSFTPPPGYTWVEEWQLWVPPGQAPLGPTIAEVRAQHQAETFLGGPIGLVRNYRTRPRRHPLDHYPGDAWHQIPTEPEWTGGENAGRLRGRR